MSALSAWWRAGFAAALIALCASAEAGRGCDAALPAPGTIARALDLAQRTARRLDESGARVVVLARAGQNLDEYHLRYSHLGFAYRDADGWRVMHKLNDCGTAHAALYRQGLGEFFLDDLYRDEAAVVVPTADVQDKLLPVLHDDARLAQLNTPAYNMVAYPWSQQYQQSNQWAIETLAMTQDPDVTTRRAAQAWLREHDFRPTTLHIDALKRLGARVTAANVAFDDHPGERRFTDRIDTVTVDSVFDWLQRSGLGGDVQVLR